MIFKASPLGGARTALKNLCLGFKPRGSVESYFNCSPETDLAVSQSSIPILEGSSNSVSESVGFRILVFWPCALSVDFATKLLSMSQCISIGILSIRYNLGSSKGWNNSMPKTTRSLTHPDYLVLELALDIFRNALSPRVSLMGKPQRIDVNTNSKFRPLLQHPRLFRPCFANKSYTSRVPRYLLIWSGQKTGEMKFSFLYCYLA